MRKAGLVLGCVAGLSGCGDPPGNLAGGRARWHPGPFVPLLAPEATRRGNVQLVAVARRASLAPVVLDNRGRILRGIDDTLRLGFDATLRVAADAGLRLGMDGGGYGAEGWWRRGWGWAEGCVHLGVRAQQVAAVRKDSVYPALLDLFGTPGIDSGAVEATRPGPTAGASLVLAPDAWLRPWLAWRFAWLPDAGLESSVQPVVRTSTALHELGGGLVAGRRDGWFGWAGGGLAVAGGRTGWFGGGGMGWGF